MRYPAVVQSEPRNLTTTITATARHSSDTHRSYTRPEHYSLHLLLLLPQANTLFATSHTYNRGGAYRIV